MGGILARYMLETCPLYNKLVKRFIFLASPNLGTFHNDFPVQLIKRPLFLAKSVFILKFNEQKIYDIQHTGLDTYVNMDEITDFKFVKINAAYSVLGNKKQRRIYDLEVLMHDDPRLVFN